MGFTDLPIELRISIMEYALDTDYISHRGWLHYYTLPTIDFGDY